jgi:transitional endoplasmic reticulum ATPase
VTHPPAEHQSLSLTARLVTAPLDARRGIVRLHRETLASLGLPPWSAVRLTGRRSTAAWVAVAADGTPRGEIRCDDLTMGNLGLADGARVTIEPAEPRPAAAVVLAGPPEILQVVPPGLVRRALIGKVLTEGDNVSLLPQDVAPGGAADLPAVRRSLSAALGMAWTSALLTVVGTTPDGHRLVTAETIVNGHAPVAPPAPVPTGWAQPAGRTAAVDSPEDVIELADWSEDPVTVAATRAADRDDAEVPDLADLSWLAPQADRLREWLDLSFHHGPLLARLGSVAALGVLVTGPDGAGKSTLVRAVAEDVGAAVVRRLPSDLLGLPHNTAVDVLNAALAEALAATPAVLLLEEVEALAPAAAGPPGTAAAPLARAVRELVARAAATDGIALVCTAVSRDAVDPALRRPALLDKEIGVPLPDRGQRETMLATLLRGVPLAEDVQLPEVAARTPGFVTADLLALRREAAVRAALRQRDAPTATIAQADLLGALDLVNASTASRSTVDVPAMSLDDVGDMAETKQALTETVLWPLAYPESFARLGIQPPRGVLLYGPPGCGKTFLVRALAGTGQLNVIVIKGAELLSMWVGESERGVRELFDQARDAAPALIFLDEIDALAPARGQSTDSGVTDRVVAALLTELDGVESLRDVVVIGATNRPDMIDPALLRPGRLERLIYVPPPDAEARTAILRASARNTPLASDVDLAVLGGQTEGFSAADCAALIREAGLAAMRRALDAAEVTAADLAAARTAVHPSLRADQLANLEAFASLHQPR